MLNKKYLLIYLLFLTISCNNEKVKDKTLLINVEKAFDKNVNTTFKINQIASDVEYIPLETNDSCLIGDNKQIYASENYIWTVTNRNIFLFDRKTGQFIRKVAGYGEAPDNFTGNPIKNFRVIFALLLKANDPLRAVAGGK